MGRGFVREEVKALAFRAGHSLSASSIQSFDSWITSFLPEKLQAWPIVGELGRRTLLDQLFRAPEIQIRFPLISERRRRRRFLERLDRELERGRTLYSTVEESEAQLSRWEEIQGKDEYIREYWVLAQVLESVLKDRQILDQPLLMRSVLENLPEWTTPKDSPQKYILLIAGPLLPLEQAVIQELRGHFEIELRGVEYVDASDSSEKSSAPTSLQRRSAHTLEDSAAFLCDEIQRGIDQEHAIVIEDDKNIRRVLSRCLRERGLMLRDPRNPMQLLESEPLKIEMLELELVVSRFEYTRAMTWMKTKDPTKLDLIRNAGRRDHLDLVLPELAELKKKWPDKLSLREFTKILIPSLKSVEIEGLLNDWLEQVRLFDADHRKRPLAVWAEQLNDAVRKVKPATQGMRFSSRIGIYRVDQIPGLLIGPSAKIHFFGLSDKAFKAEEEVFDFYSHRFCEKLSGDWPLPVRAQKQKLKETLLRLWCATGSEPVSWEFNYDQHGKEQEDLSADWIDVGLSSVAEEWNVHPKYVQAYENILQTNTAQLQIDLPPESLPKKFTFLDQYGECAFKAYGRFIAKWENKEDSDWDVRADWRGKVLHTAVEWIVKKGADVKAALDSAWGEHKAEGWFRSERIERATKVECLKILNEFVLAEAAYMTTSKAKPKLFERDLKMELEIEGLNFTGYPDRVDEHADGMVILDYKTGSNLPNAKDLLTKGRGYQLGLYALAIQKQIGVRVIGAQYVRLARDSDKNKRNKGVFFPDWNGSKAKAAISQVRPNNGGFVGEMTPEDFWKEVESRLELLVKRLKSGDFSAGPLDEKVCDRCPYSVCCGQTRRALQSEEV